MVGELCWAYTQPCNEVGTMLYLGCNMELVTMLIRYVTY